MSRAASMPEPGTEFHAFLFALIGEDRNGTPLSVISALARMNLDPWEEAAMLAELPADTAVQKVVALFRNLPDESLGNRDRTTLATHLSALLPRTAGSRSTFSAAPVKAGDATQARLGAGALLFAIFVFALMAIQFVIARFDPPAQEQTSPAPASISTHLQTPLPARSQ